MTQLLVAVRDLLIEKLVTDNQYLTSVQVLDAGNIDAILKAASLPCAIVSPGSERHEPGQFANTARQVMSIEIFIMAHKTDPNAYNVPPVTGSNTNKTIYEITDFIRDVLYQNKIVASNTFEMRPTFNCQAGQTVSGLYTVRSVFVEYTKLELYTGMQNNQVVNPTTGSALNPPYELE